MQLEGQDVVHFLTGVNSVRDGKIVGLSVLAGDAEPNLVIQLTFYVPRGANGDIYTLALSGDVTFGYNFSSEFSFEDISFFKCLMTTDQYFYISLDPWKEDENFVSEQDNDWFKSKSVELAVEQSAQPR